MSKEKKVYPECEKLRKHNKDVETILSFLEFVAEKKVALCDTSDDTEVVYAGVVLIYSRPEGVRSSRVEKLVYEFFGIDEGKLERERKKMLEDFMSQ